MGLARQVPTPISFNLNMRFVLKLTAESTRNPCYNSGDTVHPQ